MAEKRTERGGLEAYGVGIVVDNRDPERKGRIKLYLGAAGGGASAGSGPWTLPEVGTQAAYILTNAERCEGVALGFVRDESRRPPETSAKKAANSKVIQTRKHRIEIIEEDGKEEIRAESAGGKMRAVISKDGGISLVNELGDINIKCRSLRVEGDGVAMQACGAVTLRTEDEFKAKADGKIAVESGSEVKVAGKNVRLHGSRGVSAEGDRVLGFDVHVMTVPSGTGTADVPLPHPFMGRLKDKLAKDVRLGSRKCAVKGSVARHDDATHMQLPGTIKFQQNPKKEGEVTGGTSAKVKMDGKEAAVIGSTATTCNDVGARDNSTVMAAGASMPMPTIINPLNTEKWKCEREEEKKKEPEFSSAKWTKTSAKWNPTAVDEGEEAELTATVKDIADGNTVTLQVFPEGKGPEDGAAYAKLPVTVKDGTASARWSYRADRREVSPEENPRFVFTAHSAWCNFARSGNALEVKLKRPEITKAGWRDKDGNAASKGLVGEPLKLHVEVRDFEDGQGVTLTVRNAATGEEVFQTGAEVRDGIAEVEWTYHYNGERLTEKPKFTFEVTGNRCRKAKSPEVEIGANIRCHITDIFENPGKDILYTLMNDDEKIQDGKVNSEGNLKAENLIPGNIHLLLSDETEGELKAISGNLTDEKNVIKVSEAELNTIKIKMDLTAENLVIISPDTAPASF